MPQEGGCYDLHGNHTEAPSGRVDMEIENARHLTPGEIKEAKLLLKNSINYQNVFIHNEAWFPFGLQTAHTAVSPDGDIYFLPSEYRENFASSTLRLQHLFMHEMMHVWQYQHGYHVKLRGMFSWAVSYFYTLERGRSLKTYALEQQACIVADYWVLKYYSVRQWAQLKKCLNPFSFNDVAGLLSLYETVIDRFAE
ncbi:vgr related protein [Cronobacter sakazakii]